jgi:2-methylisocitrate lyase-like PEP mutase family enzyme
MSGFAVSAARLGLPDTGLISYGEMLEQGRNICNAVSIPVIGDGDTGYGNALNVKRTVSGYAQAGFGCVMIEDQVAPKRCGHTRGKQVVDREEAVGRIRAAVDAREEGADILIMARTDARAPNGFDEAMWRIKAFAGLGADILFLEAPESEDEMRDFCDGVPGHKMANLVEQGDTPLLPPEALHQMGFKIVLYPLTMIKAAMAAMETALQTLKLGQTPESLAEFAHLREVVGFEDYYEAEKKYAAGD